MDFDIGVLGLGAMGSAAARALAQRGARVVAFDQLHPPHTLGSTHGHTRIIREAYYEHPLYVPLVRRAYELWRALELESGEKLLLETGGLMVGPENDPLVAGARASAETHAIEHEMLDAKTVTARFPAYRPHREWVALLEHRAGILFPEHCVAQMMAGARRAGAELLTNTRVTGWQRNGDRIRVSTQEDTYDVDRLVVAAGPWLPSLFDSMDARPPLEIERQLSHWFQPRTDDGRFRAPGCPLGLWETTAEGDVFATMPDEGHGVKCGAHHSGSSTTPDAVNRAVDADENEHARLILDNLMPGAGGALLEARVCLYTNTPDRHFIIDWTNAGRVLVLSPCSGHGFKFSVAIGEIAAQLALDGRSWIDVAPFSLSRFA